MFRLPLLTLLAATLLALAPAPPTTAQPAPAPVQLLADLNTGTESSQFGEAVTLGPLLYFVRYVDNGGELWRSDGSAEGTVALYRFGRNVSLSNLTLVGETLYFSVYADGSQPRRELWRSDGTPAGTTLVQSFPDSNGPRNLAALGGQLLFFTNNMLWRSDGTPGGALMIKQFDPAVYQYATLATAERLFFVPGRIGGFDGPGSQLWVSDGSAEGTAILREFDPTPGASQPAPPTALHLLATHQGALYLKYERDGIREIWRSDGTAAGTLRLGPSIVGNRMYSLDDGLYFTVDSQLWRGDGTPTGSAMLFDINPTNDIRGSNTIHYLTSLGGLLFFTGFDSRYRAALWRSDGTAAGTALVSDDFSMIDYVPLRLLPAASDRLFLFANDGTHGNELWRSDGTPEGTSLVIDLTTLGASSISIIISGERAFFTAYDPVQGDTPSNLWASDGTLGGTSLISASLSLADGITLGERLLFKRYDEDGLWVSDGITVEPLPIYKDFVSTFLAKAAGRVFFDSYSYSYNQGYNIWATDGTTAGTQRLFSQSVDVRSIPTTEGVYFLYSGNDAGCRLRFSDGTPEGTTPPIPLPTKCVGVSDLTYTDGLLYFTAYKGGSNDEILWSSDGTSAGTRPLDVLPNGFFGSIVGLGGRAIIIRSEGDKIFDQLWRSDGTIEGTELFFRLDGRDLSYGNSVVVANGWAFFVTTSATAWELWSSDGSPAGTQVLLSGKQLGFSAPLYSLTPIGDLLLFAGEDGEPWLSDGTPAGTYRLHDVNPGPAASRPFSFSLAGRRLLFVADDGSHGHEPWVSTPGLALVGPSAVAAADGVAAIDLRLQEISLATSSTVTLSVTLDPALTYLGNDQDLSPTQQGDQLVFSWQAARSPLHLAPLRLRIGLPADAPTDMAYRATIAASSSDPADNPADNRLSVELRRVYRTFAPLVAQ